MSAGHLTDPDPAATLRKDPHLSHSRIGRYLLCPEQYRLYYVENLRPRFPAASMIFGQFVHQALAHLFRTGSDPVKWFLGEWDDVKDLQLTYSARESWEKLALTGQSLLETFVEEDAPKLRNVTKVEQPFSLRVTGLDLPLVGVIDLVAELDGKSTVVDFKTSGSSYESHEAGMSDQLTAYQLAEPSVEQAALCVLVKTKEPRIEWHVTQRTGGQLVEYLEKVGLVAQDIADRRFYKRPGKWCSWCDFLPVCTGDTRQAEASLKRAA